MLSEWADRIYIVEPYLRRYIQEKFKKKIKLINLGPDIWGKSLDPRLIRKILKLMKISPDLIENGIRKRLT